MDNRTYIILEFSVNILTPATVIWYSKMTLAVKNNIPYDFFLGGGYLPISKCLLWSQLPSNLIPNIWIWLSRTSSNLSSTIPEQGLPSSLAYLYAFPKAHSFIPASDHYFSYLKCPPSSFHTSKSHWLKGKFMPILLYENSSYTRPTGFCISNGLPNILRSNASLPVLNCHCRFLLSLSLFYSLLCCLSLMKHDYVVSNCLCLCLESQISKVRETSAPLYLHCANYSDDDK